jgi:AcrR family transcriptional regulator
MRVRPILSADFVADFRRRAITDAMAELCVEQGYRATTMTHVVARAKTSRNTAYQHFSGREEILLALLDQSFSQLIALAEAACQAAEPEERIEAGLSAVLTWVAEEPARAWALFVEASCATSESLRRYLEMITKFTTLLRGNVPKEVPRPATTEESLVGGIASILRFRILNGEAQRAPELLPELAAFLRMPFIATELS